MTLKSLAKTTAGTVLIAAMVLGQPARADGNDDLAGFVRFLLGAATVGIVLNELDDRRDARKEQSVTRHSHGPGSHSHSHATPKPKPKTKPKPKPKVVSKTIAHTHANRDAGAPAVNQHKHNVPVGILSNRAKYDDWHRQAHAKRADRALSAKPAPRAQRHSHSHRHLDRYGNLMDRHSHSHSHSVPGHLVPGTRAYSDWHVQAHRGNRPGYTALNSQGRYIHRH